MGSRDGVVVIALASHLRGLGSGHEWVKLVGGSLLCPKRFFSGFSGFPLSSKINISKFQFDWMQDLPDRQTVLFSKNINRFTKKYNQNLIRKKKHFWVCGASWVNINNYYY